MLAKFLRRMFLVQVLLGAGLACLLITYAAWPSWSLAAIVMLLPFLTMVLVDVITALKSRASGESAAMWWRSLFGEFGAGIRVFLLRQPWVSTPPSFRAATGSDKKIPVVLVHGYLCNNRIWDDMSSALRSAGHPVFAVDLEPLFTSIDNYAPIVESAVAQLCRQTGASQVALVGHSMGGLAIRGWMRAHGATRVARVLTLGTPHAGTQIAPNTHTPNGQQMGWRSPWLQALSAHETAEARALIRIAITPQDNIVYPQRAQVLPGIEPTIFEGIGHVQMCVDQPVIRWVLGQLASLTQVRIPAVGDAAC